MDEVEPKSLVDEARAWAEENEQALALHRERIEQFGVFGEDLRPW